MFLVTDTFEGRHNRIRSFEDADMIIGVILAAMDFEWTLRRGIIALGYQRNVIVRQNVLRHCSGLEKYKGAWRCQVSPRFQRTLPDVVPDWQFLLKDAFPLRHKLVHGVRGAAGGEYAQKRRDCMLNASAAIVTFANDCGVDLYARLPVRRRDLVL